MPVTSLLFSEGTTHVWSGTENGVLSVWRFCPVDGKLAAEEIYHKGSVSVRTGKSLLGKKKMVRLQLGCGVLFWSSPKAFHSLHVKDVDRVERDRL